MTAHENTCRAGVLFATLAVAAVCAQGDATVLQNVALGKPYALAPGPNYPHCRDAGDEVQLTDGVYDRAAGSLWVHEPAVAWWEGRPVVITVDLGQTEPIAGVSYSTAAGRAGVTWPDLIFVFVSDDRREWWEAGELLSLSARRSRPPAEGYAVHRFWTDQVRAHGRYVALVIWTSCPYCVCDEIEVYRGSPALPNASREGEPARRLRDATVDRAMRVAFRRDIMRDFGALRERVADAGLPDPERRAIDAELDAAMEALGNLDEITGRSRAVLPYNDAHARGLAVQSRLWRAAERPVFQVWQCSRWEPFAPADVPTAPAPEPAVDLRMMRNEVRGAVLNFTNASDRAVDLNVSFDGLPPGAERSVTVCETAWTRTRDGKTTASALPTARRAGRRWVVRAPAGMTRQIWLSVRSRELLPGNHAGRAILSVAEEVLTEVPLRIKVSELRMPDELSLALGGWDYADYGNYGIRSGNREATVAFLKEYHVTAPWASSFAMPFGKHDASGAMVELPSTRIMDQWLDLWRDARHYCVHVAFRQDLPDTPAARRRIADWITFWVEHLRGRSVAPSQLYLLLIDEPHTPAMDRRTIQYASAIHAAQPDVNIWMDPTWKDPADATPDLFKVANVICAHRWQWIANRTRHEETLLAHQRAGRQLAFYSCHIPARDLDPYSYYRLQAWDCFRYGMVQEMFWSFSANGGASSWTEHGAKWLCATPQFLDPRGCTTSKQMEALREGLYDHEYLVMLRERVAELEKTSRTHSRLSEARALLTEGPARVLGAHGADRPRWLQPKDRTRADLVRVQMLTVLEALRVPAEPRDGK